MIKSQQQSIKNTFKLSESCEGTKQQDTMGAEIQAKSHAALQQQVRQEPDNKPN